MEELDKKVSEIVRSTVKEFMESLMKGEIQAFLEENRGSRNGYYERDLGTRCHERSLFDSNLMTPSSINLFADSLSTF